MRATRSCVPFAMPCARSRSCRSTKSTPHAPGKAAPSPTWKRSSKPEGRSAPSVPTSRGSSRSIAGRKGKQRSAERYYDTWPLERIKAFARDFIPRLVAKDCALLLWSVWLEHRGALEVIAACGFDYKTAGFLWVKTNPGVEVITLAGKGLFTGMGYATRSNSEACLLATRGSPCEKPDEVYRRIERLYPGPYLELFARKPRGV